MKLRGFEALLQDVRVGYRGWRRNAAFAVTAVVALASAFATPFGNNP